MNSIEKINRINQQELATNTSDSASWHADYSDTPYIYIGFIPQELQELDILKIFSQYGIPTHINLIKDKDTGKSRGFAYLKYQDHRLCILAIDNLNGIQVLDKNLKVDHVYYQLKEWQNEDDFLVNYSEAKDEHLALEKREKKKKDRERILLQSNTTKLLEYKADEDVNVEVAENDEFRDPMADFDKLEDPLESFKDKKKRKHDKDRKHKKRRRDKNENEKDEKEH